MWVYVDESGDLGRKGRYFLLAAVVCVDDKTKKRIKNVVRTTKVKIAKNGVVPEELHAVNMSYNERLGFINKMIGIEELFYEVLIVDKTKITFELNRETRNIAYNYFSGLLVEKIVTK